MKSKAGSLKKIIKTNKPVARVTKKKENTNHQYKKR